MADDIVARARAIAIEQSIEMPVEAVREPGLLETVLGRVEAIEPAADAADASPPGWRVTVSLATSTVGHEAGQLLNMLFGNSSLQPDTELVDATLPADLLATLPGPAHGIAGLRALMGVPTRALTCSALKPQGLSAPALARLASEFAQGGLDLIKDDHGIADQAAAPFAERVPRVQAALAATNARHGTRCLYAPALNGGARAIDRQLALARREGVKVVLVCPMIVGLASFAELRREHPDMVWLAHPALAGVARIAAPLLLGRLFRLLGADATVFPNHGGRFSLDEAQCQAIARAAREPLGTHRACLPVPAGGIRVERVPELLAGYGPDVMLLIGGNLLQASERLVDRCEQFVRAVGGPLPGEHR